MSEENTAPLARWNVGSAVYSVSVSRDGTRVVSGSSDNCVRVWDAHTGALVLGPLKGHTKPIESVAFSPDNTRISSGSYDLTIRIWDAQTGAPIGKPLKGHTRDIESVAYSHDSALIVSGSDDRTIRLWNAHTGAAIGEPLQGHTGIVWSVAFSHDSTLIVSGSNDNTVRIWNAHTGAPIGEPLKGHTSSVLSVAFSNDSTHIVSGSSDKTVRIWAVSTGTLIGEPLKGHADMVWSAAFSYDNALIISGSKDKTIRTWDVRTGTLVGEPLQGHTDSVYSVAFSSDSSRIFSGSVDGTVGVWRTPQNLLSSDMGVGELPSSNASLPGAGASRMINSTELAPIASADAALGFEEVVQDAPSFDMVSSNMSVEEIFECLVKHGCADLTSSVDAEHRSTAVVASGGFGDIRRVALNNGTFVALKSLRLHVLRTGGDKGVKLAVREVYLWSRLSHPHIQELLGIVVFQGGLGMVSPWRANGNLQDYIVSNPDVARHPLCVQLASAVSYLHKIGMVHGDLKSMNVLVADDDTIRISDFDYAILSNTTLQFSATTRPGGGTLRWMAPELFELEDEDEDESGDDEADEAEDTGDSQSPGARTKQTDVYALGMTILEIVTGTVPYSEYQSEGKIYRAIQTKKPPKRPKQLPKTDEGAKQMWELLLQCWQHDPSTRPEASTVLASLQSFSI